MVYGGFFFAISEYSNAPHTRVLNISGRRTALAPHKVVFMHGKL
jgi:hypothetical protein